MCIYENDTKQNEVRCSSYEILTSTCATLAKSMNTTWNYEWRIATNCRKLFIDYKFNLLNTF